MKKPFFTRNNSLGIALLILTFLNPLLSLIKILVTNFLLLIFLNIGFLTALWLSSLDAYILNWEQKEFIIHTKLCSGINLEQQNSNHLISTHKCRCKATHRSCKGESRSHLSLCAVSSVCQKFRQMIVRNREYKIFR